MSKTVGAQSFTSSIDLTDASYGVVTSADATSVTIGGFHIGNATPTSSMPSNVTATYSGVFLGAAIDTGATRGMTENGALAGVVNMTADFTKGSVDGRVSDIRQDGFLSTNVDIKMNGTISGSTYKGTASLVEAGTSTAVGTVTSSAHQGGFYGAGAAETAGAICVEASGSNLGLPRFGNGTGTAIVGAYGAKKQ